MTTNVALEKNDTLATGLLNVEVKAPPLVAGKVGVISLVIRNPFREAIMIEPIESPLSGSLLRRQKKTGSDKSVSGQGSITGEAKSAGVSNEDSYWDRLRNFLKSDVEIRQISLGGMVAQFPGNSGRSISIKMEKNSKCVVKGPFGKNDDINVENAEGAEVHIDLGEEDASAQVGKPDASSTERTIGAGQEDIASFNIKISNWLFSKPTTLNFHALLRYRVGESSRSQVVPVTVPVRPPVTALVVGCLTGSTLGFFARQINTGVISSLGAFSWELAFNALGVSVMAIIVAIVLSRSDTSRGFITLEDFYGAFVVGVLTGYLGTEYFEELIAKAKEGS